MTLSDLFRAVAALFSRAPEPVPAATGSPAPGVPAVPSAAPMQASQPEIQAQHGDARETGLDWLALCRPLTAAAESCVLIAYPDPASGGDPWTIGYGATGAGIAKGVTWTQAQADARLDADLARFAAAVDRHVTAPLTPAQKAALVDFVFNVGEGNFTSSTLLRKLNAGDYDGAADELPRWNLAAGKVMPGLVVRRARERDLFLTGKWS
ncbi:lysozyme [Burkholderia gladioli]|uniref:lysozyme n=1 Tax=Burkholderia gladioli TaxID=28095 RepID=UPI0016404290|nr:lysozyme [Burkholderia gladioli]